MFGEEDGEDAEVRDEYVIDESVGPFVPASLGNDGALPCEADGGCVVWRDDVELAADDGCFGEEYVN